MCRGVCSKDGPVIELNREDPVTVTMQGAHHSMRLGWRQQRCRIVVWLLWMCCCLLPVTSRAGEPQPAAGWRLIVHATELPAVDNIVLAPDGSLYVTLERRAPHGRLVRVHQGKSEVLLDGLDRADGLFLNGDTLYITEEVPNGRLIEYRIASDKHRELARVDMGEGIDVLPDGALVVSEDKPGGRVLRLDRNGELTVLAADLRRPEGLCVDADGVIYVAETGRGRVLALRPDGTQREWVSGLNEPDQIECAPDGALWISEDQPAGRLLRYLAGDLQIIASQLHEPQGIALAPDGSVYLAEQGRGRILKLIPKGKDAPADR